MGIINQPEIEIYWEIFERLTESQADLIDGLLAKTFFPRSGLSRIQLARIWRLADYDQDSKLNFQEFCIAMHLTIATMKGIELPTELPETLQPDT